MVLPYSVAKDVLGMTLIPQGVKEEKDCRPRWIGNYSYYNTNIESLPIAALPTIQYGRTFDRLIREVVIADPALGTIY